MSLMKSARDLNVKMTVPVGVNAKVADEGYPVVPVRLGFHHGKKVCTTAWQLSPDQLTLLIENGGLFEVHIIGDSMPPIAVQIAG